MGGSSLAHTRWDCSYHIIFIPKFRRKVFFKEIRKDVGEILRKLCEFKNVEQVKGSISADHVLKIPPKLSVSETPLGGASTMPLIGEISNHPLNGW